MPIPALGLDPELKSGHPVLEFTNTVGYHASANPGESLFEYAHLLGWAQRVGLLDQARVQALTALAVRRAREAAFVLTRAIELREALYRIFVASIRDKPPESSDMALLNRALDRVTGGARLTRRAGAFVWEWNTSRDTLELPVDLIALSAADLLTSEHLPRLGQCADEDGCGWLFVDTSRNHSRRWCDIDDCGNRAKQRRYQQRARRTDQSRS